MRVRCLHCHEPTDVPDDSDFSRITCSICGGSFNLWDKDTVGYSERSPESPRIEVRKLGHFELLRQLGTGGFGKVWMARDTELERTVAVKIPRFATVSGEEIDLFLREARAAAQLQHPHIVSVHEIGRDDDTVYIVSDFIRGGTLRERMRAGRLTAREAAELCAKIATALEHAHQAGVIHRDLKPSNVMVDEEGNPHVMDFGLARREVGEVTMTRDGQVVGTPAYMSPEQARGESHRADRRSDVYSLGVILYELLTGERPFRGNPSMLAYQIVHDEPPRPRKFDQKVPRDLETICLKCLHKNPDRRYQTAEALAADLRRWLAGEPIQARPVSSTERMVRWCGRKPAAAAALGLLVFTLLLTSVGLWWMAMLRQQERRGLRQSLYHQAQALRESSDPERREKALEALRQAAAIQPGFELREEYIRCLDLVGLRPAGDLPLPEWRPFAGDFAAFCGEDQILIVRPGRSPQLIDASDGKLVRDLVCIGAVTSPALLSPDGRYLAAATSDGKRTNVWDLEGERLVGALRDAEGCPVRARCLAFSGDNRRLAVAREADEGRFELLIYDAKSLQLADSWQTDARDLDCLCFAPNPAGLLASVVTAGQPRSHAVKYWLAATHREKVVMLGEGSWRGHGGFHSRRLALSDGGRVFVAGGTGGTVKGWEIAPGKDGAGAPDLDRELFSFQAHTGAVLAAQISPDVRWLATTGKDGLLKLWNVESGSLEAQAAVGVDMAPHLQWSLSGTYILCDTARGLRRWQLIPPLARRYAFSQGSSPLQFSQQERWLAHAFSHSVVLVDLGKPDNKSLQVPVEGVSALAFSPDDERIGLGFHDGHEVWELPAVRRVERQRGQNRDVRALAFTASGDLISAGIQGGLHFEARSLQTGDMMLRFMPENRFETGLDGEKSQRVGFLPVHLVSTHLALVDQKKQGPPFLQVFELAGRTKILNAECPSSSSRIALAGDGRWVALADQKRILLYDIPLRQPVATLEGHESSVTDLSFDRFGKQLASISAGDETARLWNVATKELLAVFHTGQRHPTQVALSSSGGWLAIGSADGQLHLWNLNELRQHLRSAQLDWTEGP